jgi:hypothetical protein
MCIAVNPGVARPPMWDPTKKKKRKKRRHLVVLGTGLERLSGCWTNNNRPLNPLHLVGIYAGMLRPGSG